MVGVVLKTIDTQSFSECCTLFVFILNVLLYTLSIRVKSEKSLYKVKCGFLPYYQLRSFIKATLPIPCILHVESLVELVT